MIVIFHARIFHKRNYLNLIDKGNLLGKIGHVGDSLPLLFAEVKSINLAIKNAFKLMFKDASLVIKHKQNGDDFVERPVWKRGKHPK